LRVEGFWVSGPAPALQCRACSNPRPRQNRVPENVTHESVTRNATPHTRNPRHYIRKPLQPNPIIEIHYNRNILNETHYNRNVINETHYNRNNITETHYHRKPSLNTIIAETFNRNLARETRNTCSPADRRCCSNPLPRVCRARLAPTALAMRPAAERDFTHTHTHIHTVTVTVTHTHTHTHTQTHTHTHTGLAPTALAMRPAAERDFFIDTTLV